MPQIHRSALVPFSAEKMFQLVNDVESYPDFLPGCCGSKILAQSEAKMTASVDVSKAGITKTFVTENRWENHQSIEMALVDGPFRKLCGGWRFTPLDTNACKIEFNLDFEFNSALIELAFGQIFKELTGNMVGAFTQRAKEIYGP